MGKKNLILTVYHLHHLPFLPHVYSNTSNAIKKKERKKNVFFYPATRRMKKPLRNTTESVAK